MAACVASATRWLPLPIVVRGEPYGSRAFYLLLQGLEGRLLFLDQLVDRLKVLRVAQTEGLARMGKIEQVPSTGHHLELLICAFVEVFLNRFRLREGLYDYQIHELACYELRIKWLDL